MQSKSQLTNFENIEDKFANVVSSEEYQQLVNLFQKHDEIYVVANGGLHYVASHMATDISRLVESKHVYSFDSFGFITSSANDFGFDSIFERWIRNCVPKDKKSLLLGLSCSGKSKNILNVFEYVKSLDWDVFLISGKCPTVEVPNINLNAQHFHTVECICLMLFYEIIHSLGAKCPVI